MIFLFTRYGRKGASSRVRTFQYFDEKNILYPRKTIFNILINDYQHEYKQKNKKYKFPNIVLSYLLRLKILFKVNSKDLIYIEKELFPYLPYFLESILLYKKNYILNYDDAVFDYYESNKNTFIKFLLKNKHKLLMKSAKLTICGNSFLSEYAHKTGCKNIKKLPSVIDFKRYENPKIHFDNKNPIICWIGSIPSGKHLLLLKNVFKELSHNHEFILRIIGFEDYFIDGVNIERKKWFENNEIEELRTSDIGIMPLLDNRFSLGKCGFKLIQYMAIGLPVVASNIGANKNIVENGKNGFLANNSDDWIYYLKLLINDYKLRKKLGEKGRNIVEKKYSVQSTKKTFISFFKN